MAHHGILGMRWGKRNGPPYPLDASDHSSSEKKAGWRKSLSNDDKKKKLAKSYNADFGKTQTDAYAYKEAYVRKKTGLSIEEARKQGYQKVVSEADKKMRKKFDPRFNNVNKKYIKKQDKLDKKSSEISKYSSPDGTINEAGKQKFFSKNENGSYSINKAGHDFNNKGRKKVEQYANATVYNVKKNPEFKKVLDEYKAASLKDHEAWQSEYDKWSKQEGKYKGKDYYQFKEMTRDKWAQTNDARRQKEAYSKLESLVREAAKEHPLYNKSHYEIDGVNYVAGYSKFEKVNDGEQAVKIAMSMLRWELEKDRNKK
jgi:hypothetical protein